MDSFIVYLILFGVIVVLGECFRNFTIPIALILVISGMLLSFIPFFPKSQLNPSLVLNIFLPFLIYEISAFSSWRDMAKQARPVALLSIGHVVFITCLVALVTHTLIPKISWPLAFILGAIIAPPDDVAIISIAEKIRIPERIFIILEGEGMFNDAAALTLFRFALVAAMTHQFLLKHALIAFIVIIIGETLYGFILGHLLGQLRCKIRNTKLHIIASLITPFLAYIPVVELGGSGIIATTLVGFIIGNQYALKFTPEYRLASIMLLPTLAFSIQSILFLLVGLNMHSTLMHISSIPIETVLIFVFLIISLVIIGRFIWVFGFVVFLPRFLFPSLQKKEPYPLWKYPFLISWAGIRGGISLAAALAIPALIFKVGNVDIRDLFVFVTFCTIFVTLILQGLSLPFIMQRLGIQQVGESERYREHLSELHARVQMINAAVHWLRQYKKDIKKNKKLFTEISIHIYEYQMLKKKFESRILEHNQSTHDEEAELRENLSLLCQTVEIEKTELARLWRKNLINLKTRNKLATILDHQIQRNLI